MTSKIAFAFLVLAACGDNHTPQSITGRVGSDFPKPVIGISVVEAGRVITSTPVSADGTFELQVMPAKGLSLHVLMADGHSTIVFPRSLGQVERTFGIAGAGVPFDLGTVHFVGTSTTTTVVFKTAGEQETDCDDDGEDANGAQCVDDGDVDNNMCEADGENNDDEGDNEEADDAGDDDDDDSSANDAQDGADDGDSVVDHNFPADDCADGGDNGGDDDGGEEE